MSFLNKTAPRHPVLFFPLGLMLVTIQVAQEKPAQRQNPIIATVDQSKRVSLNGQPVTARSLGKQLLSALAHKNTKSELMIQADPAVEFSDLVEIIDTGAGVGVEKIALRLMREETVVPVFLVTADPEPPPQEAEVSIDYALARNCVSVPVVDAVRFSIIREGGIFRDHTPTTREGLLWTARPLTQAQLAAIVAEEMDERTDRTVFLRIDGPTPYSHVAEVLRILQGARCDRVALLTLKQP
ncbi:MAG: hypothetical protein GY953_20890 [bacterium]|nr:hypothetical protein [bacterium]